MLTRVAIASSAVVVADRWCRPQEDRARSRILHQLAVHNPHPPPNRATQGRSSAAYIRRVTSLLDVDWTGCFHDRIDDLQHPWRLSRSLLVRAQPSSPQPPSNP